MFLVISIDDCRKIITEAEPIDANETSKGHQFFPNVKTRGCLHPENAKNLGPSQLSRGLLRRKRRIGFIQFPKMDRLTKKIEPSAPQVLKVFT